jgi:hypothetical protein
MSFPRDVKALPSADEETIQVTGDDVDVGCGEDRANLCALHGIANVRRPCANGAPTAGIERGGPQPGWFKPF